MRKDEIKKKLEKIRSAVAMRGTHFEVTEIVGELTEDIESLLKEEE